MFLINENGKKVFKDDAGEHELLQMQFEDGKIIDIVLLNRTNHPVNFTTIDGVDIQFRNEDRCIRLKYTNKRIGTLENIPIVVEQYYQNNNIVKKSDCLYDEKRSIWNPKQQERIFYLVSRVVFDSSERIDVCCPCFNGKIGQQKVWSKGLVFKKSSLEWIESWKEIEFSSIKKKFMVFL